MNEPVVFSYLAEKVSEDIRKGSLKPEIALALRIFPFKAYIREKLSIDDVVHITRLFKNKNDEIKAFALMISSPFQKDENVKQAILDLWKNDRGSFLVGFNSIYRLLVYEDITSNLREEFFGYIKKHWKEWKQKLVTFYPEPKRIIPFAKSRINNPNFLKWKKWIYLVEVACSPEKKNAKAFLDNFKTSDPFEEKIRKWALSCLRS
ncbi:MAG TPA: hypothetical protein ENK96_01860 [Desulfobulbaceae bacterium]|nr:hypothetical protein [Desulfobulbaceae bacterium]